MGHTERTDSRTPGFKARSRFQFCGTPPKCRRGRVSPKLVTADGVESLGMIKSFFL